MYERLGYMLFFTFIIMYILTYTMIDNSKHAYNNLNYVYMNILMVSIMLILEIIFMRNMYPNKFLNNRLIVIGIIILVFVFYFIREQTFINDKEFLKSMIPHHSSGILMARKIKDKTQNPNIKILAENIIKTQDKEIEDMKKLLENM